MLQVLRSPVQLQQVCPFSAVKHLTPARGTSSGRVTAVLSSCSPSLLPEGGSPLLTGRRVLAREAMGMFPVCARPVTLALGPTALQGLSADACLPPGLARRRQPVLAPGVWKQCIQSGKHPPEQPEECSARALPPRRGSVWRW